MKEIIAIDPGPIQSAYVIWDGMQIIESAIWPNEDLLELLRIGVGNSETLVIEQVRSYGMPVGATVFDTVFWSGRFYQAWNGEAYQVPRMDVKMHLCHNSRAKDSNIITALVDRFAYGQRNRGKGTKASPGFFYGFRADIWQAFALAVTFLDGLQTNPK